MKTFFENVEEMGGYITELAVNIQGTTLATGDVQDSLMNLANTLQQVVQYEKQHPGRLQKEIVWR